MNSMTKPKRGRSTGAIDDFVGGRIRERRIMLGLTQQQLAEMIGVTYQQAHKYERGINRVSAGRLYQIARALSVPVASISRSASVDFPWSMCATIQKFLMREASMGAER